MFKNVLTISLFLFSVLSFGRAPAVEPVTGIDIGKYKEVDPAQDPGFNWRQGEYVQETSIITTRVPAQKALIEKTRNQTKTWPTYAFLLGLITLPFVLWYSIMKGLEDNESYATSEVHHEQPVLNNTVDLHQEREKRRRETENDDISKAS
jgi:hypothetical protein